MRSNGRGLGEESNGQGPGPGCGFRCALVHPFDPDFDPDSDADADSVKPSAVSVAPDAVKWCATTAILIPTPRRCT